ncbi:MAG: mechanosensitive ion channel domain-containing protein [Byssovorax sp.]
MPNTATSWASLFKMELFKLSGASVTPTSILVFLATLVGAVIAGRLVRRVTTSFLISRGGAQAQGTAYAVARMAQYLIALIVVLMGLDNIGLSLSSLAVFGTFLSVGVGFGLQNIVQNFVSGLILLIERPVQKGDFVRIGDTAGTVEEIAMRATRLITRDGIAIIVPNSELISGRVINLSAPTATYRVRVAVGVAYGSDTSAVRRVLLGVAQSELRVLEAPPPAVFFRDFADSALAFELCVWLQDPHEEPLATSDLRFAIDAAFREAGIEIPFPQRDLHLRSGLPAPSPEAPSDATSTPAP